MDVSSPPQIVDRIALVAFGLGLCVALTLDDVSLAAVLIALMVVGLVPFLWNRSPFTESAPNAAWLSQVLTLGIALLVVSEHDWLRIAPVSVLVLGTLMLLKGSEDTITRWVIMGGAVWLPLSLLLNTNTQFSTDVWMPLSLYVGGVFFFLTYSIESLTRTTEAEQLTDAPREDLSDLLEELHTVASTTQAIANQQASRAEQQDQVVSDMQTSLMMFREMVHRVENNTDTMRSAVEHAAAVSDDGHDIIHHVLDSMQQTHAAVEQVGHAIAQLAVYLRRIGQIIASVSDIATQSNFLALNAQLEAARAGERGRGFTIVADEVRDLADQSRQATGDVRGILKDIQEAVSAAIDVIEAGVNGVDQSLRQAQDAAEIIHQLQATVDTEKTVSESIETALATQLDEVSRLEQLMQNLGQIVLHNQAAARMATSVSENLNELSGKLSSAVALEETDDHSKNS